MIRDGESTSNRIHDTLVDDHGRQVGGCSASLLKRDLPLRYLRPDSRVLDVGCANGLHLRLLAPHCSEIHGVDIHEKMLSLAARCLVVDGISNVHLSLQNAVDLSYSAESFDLVYSFSTLLLVSDLQKALEEIARVLRPGGYAVLDVQGRYNLCASHHRHYFMRRGHFGPRAFAGYEIVGLFREMGFSIVESHAFGVLDQWKYVPGLRSIFWGIGLDRVIHSGSTLDLDYRVSNHRRFIRCASQWYFVLRKRSRG